MFMPCLSLSSDVETEIKIHQTTQCFSSLLFSNFCEHAQTVASVSCFFLAVVNPVWSSDAEAHCGAEVIVILL